MASVKPCYYETLGVGRNADDKALKAAFRKLAMQYHPDRNNGDSHAEARFKEINEAYEVLRDPQRRAAYDRFGHAAFEQGGFGGGRRSSDFAGSFSDIFDDLFGEFMGGRGRGQSQARRGGDLRYDLEITLEQAYRGVTEDVTIPTAAACDACNGSGAADGAAPETCRACSGTGAIRSTQGFFMVERTCTTCRGTGRVIAEPCRTCHGQGTVRRQKTLSVKIPAGVDNGTRIRLAGEGEAGLRGGPPGDLYIFVSVAPHAMFQRDGTTIGCTVPITMTTAALGGEVTVPTIDGGRAKLRIPAGTQSGRQFRLKGKGMPQLGASGLYGDMVLLVRVETPVNLSKRQKELLREFAEMDNGNSPDSSGFFAKVRELWNDLTE
ncbi:MAG: molecular chaperone DnaJ [Alphaproteobacteria bacterium]|nr:MAG: molecular chaperone DnaJ [Alphaproteobacteria bacterium]